MTTRRVIILVLAIILALPFFKPSLWKDNMATSAKYGVNVLYRRFVDDMLGFQPWANDTQSAKYLSSKAREVYVANFHSYIYYHNPFCDEMKTKSDVASPEDNLAALFWLGIGGTQTDATQYFLPRHHGFDRDQLNAQWNGRNWFFQQCNLTDDAVKLLDMPASDMKACLSGSVKGVPLAKA